MLISIKVKTKERSEYVSCQLSVGGKVGRGGCNYIKKKVMGGREGRIKKSRREMTISFLQTMKKPGGRE